MNVEPIICFQNVSKRFAFTKEKPQSILETVISSFSRRKFETRDLWAVHDVSFDVLPGQCFGIVGRNGSGKSTILKLMTRILRPNEGRIVVHGRVSALLELGAGFHHDLTGRENISLNASLLGLDEAETNAQYEDIVAFSELGEFIDMPVKHYSSGMYMRLGFSVAIHMQPDILIVDEILAVGDQAFQTKCTDAIMELKRRGTTIILVSHNLNLMRSLCTHLLWMDNGRMRAIGTTDEIATQYKAYSHEREERQLLDENESFERQGSQDVQITAVRFLDEQGAERQTFQTGEPLIIEMDYMAHKPVENPEFGLAIHRQDGVHVNGPNTKLAGLDMGVVQGAGMVRYCIDQIPLLPARYMVTTAVHDGQTHRCYDYHIEAYSFRVVTGGTKELDGLIAMTADWDWQPALAEDQDVALSNEMQKMVNETPFKRKVMKQRTMLFPVVVAILFFAITLTTTLQAGEIQNNHPTTATLNEFPIPFTNGAPQKLVAETVGPPASIWFTMPNANAIGHLVVTDTTDYLFEKVDVPTGNSQPYDLAYDSSDTIWFTEKGANALGRLHLPTRTITEYVVPTNNSIPTGIDVAPNGQVWFLEQAGNNVGQFDPVSETFVGEYAYPKSGGQLESISIVNNDSIWFTVPMLHLVSDYRPSKDDFVDVPVVSGPGGITFSPADIVAGNNQVWVSAPSQDWIGIHFPGTFAFWDWASMLNPGGEPTGIDLSSPDGRSHIWFVESAAGRVGKYVTNVQGQTFYHWVQAIPAANSMPVDIVADDNEHGWATVQGSNEIVEWIPPATIYTINLPAILKP
ncbi:MAG: ATP-binding cassette domain-containing protein [Chloroflexi bacterium]|nr:ATP-binding cassette domain-containing protein [Chloroflexota bacterium]